MSAPSTAADQGISRRSYSTVEVARRLGVSLQSVQRWVDAGRLVAWKTPGGHRRIDAESAEALFASQPITNEVRPPPETTAPRRPRVLIADDDPIDREVVQQLVWLALPEAEIELAEDGFQALVKFGALHPDVLISDLRMPNLDGVEMLRSLVRMPRASQTAFMAMSAHGPEDLAHLGALPPNVTLFRKPVDVLKMAQALRKAINESK